MAFAAAEHWVCLLVMAGLGTTVSLLRKQRGMHAAERWRERRMREELEAYAEVDTSLTRGMGAGLDPMETGRALAKRVCRVVAEKSVFRRVTMLLRNAEGRFVCVGSVGVDDLTVAALHEWCEKVVGEERTQGAARSIRAGVKSFAIPLGEWGRFDPEVGTWALEGKRERRRWRRAMVAPVRTRTGRLMGAIVVCADGTAETGVEKAMGAIETLAARLSTAMENELLAERLLRAEKLAGLGQLAGGVAHALNNPLTAVLGFAELIAETTGDVRVRQDAGTIVGEALKMKETVEKLTEFWRPAPPADEAVTMLGLVREIAGSCEETLRERGVQLLVVAEEPVPMVRGCRDRLRQVMEHLLNNAAQAIAGARPREEGEEHTIRVTVSHDDRAVHVIVSDTGPGFKDAARVFDPFYTTKETEQGAGMGLSICYAIVREHGGAISAFNLHPHGAAVVVELPVAAVVTGAVVSPVGVGRRAKA